MGIPIPYCIYSKIQPKNSIWKTQERYLGNNAKLCRYKNVKIIESVLCADRVHLCIAIPPKYSIISSFVRYLKVKSALMIFDTYSELASK